MLPIPPAINGDMITTLPVTFSDLFSLAKFDVREFSLFKVSVQVEAVDEYLMDALIFQRGYKSKEITRQPGAASTRHPTYY